MNWPKILLSRKNPNCPEILFTKCKCKPESTWTKSNANRFILKWIQPECKWHEPKPTRIWVWPEMILDWFNSNLK